jgi:hypothetical protein
MSNRVAPNHKTFYRYTKPVWLSLTSCDSAPLLMAGRRSPAIRSKWAATIKPLACNTICPELPHPAPPVGAETNKRA